MLADDHTHVGLGLRIDEKYAAILQVPKAICQRHAAFHRYQSAVAAVFDATDERTKLKEAVVHDALAFRISQKLAPKADEAARRDLKLDPSLSVAGRVHRDHLGLSASELFDHGAAKLVRHVAH